jgi:hypothetical protein
MPAHTILDKTFLFISKRTHTAMVQISEASLTKETETCLSFLAHFYFSFTTILPFWEEEKLNLKTYFWLVSEGKYSVHRHCMLWVCLPATSEEISDFHDTSY